MSRNPRSYFFSAATSAVCLATLLATFAACRDSRVVSYQAPKDPATESAPALAAPDASGISTAPQIQWTAPERWSPTAPENAAAANVRVGSFTITAADGSAQTADMAITTFPGDVGGDLANINRWRGQLNLAPITAAQLPAAFTTITVPAGEFLLADMTSEAIPGDTTPRKRTLGAWFKQPAQNRTWFFKLTGDADLVAAEHDVFLAFLNTVIFAAPSK